MNQHITTITRRIHELLADFRTTPFRLRTASLPGLHHGGDHLPAEGTRTYSGWVCADVFEVGRQRWRLFDTAIANPPFGPRPRTGNAPGYRGPRFEYHVIALASHLARHGVFLVPQTSAPFRYSGGQEMLEGQGDAEYKRFSSGTGIALEPGCSVDTAFHDPYWHQPAPRTEIVTTEFGDTALARRRRARSRARAGAVVAPWDRATRAS